MEAAINKEQAQTLNWTHMCIRKFDKHYVKKQEAENVLILILGFAWGILEPSVFVSESVCVTTITASDSK